MFLFWFQTTKKNGFKKNKNFPHLNFKWEDDNQNDFLSFHSSFYFQISLEQGKIKTCANEFTECVFVQQLVPFATSHLFVELY